jgi:hypothetical protein
MSMSQEERDRLRDRNRARANCRRCGHPVRLVDGEKLGAFPGINYRVCGGCGHESVAPKCEQPKRTK